LDANGSPGTVASDVKNPFSLQGLGMVIVIALLLAPILCTPSAHAQKDFCMFICEVAELLKPV
jgi:hypothetical protein